MNLDDKDQVEFFLTRLLTESEMVMLMRRWEIAEMLVGGLTYEQIQKKLRVGKSTIGGVDRWLTDAAYEYQLIREEQREAAREKTEQERITRIVRKRQRSLVNDLPDELQRLVRGDSRMILLRFLLGDL